MSLIIIRSKRNGISIEIPGGGVFGADPDGDFIAQLGSSTGTVSLKDARTGRFFAKDHPFHQFRLNSSETDKGSGSSMGSDAATVTNNLNAILNRTTKLAEIDEVELQSAAAGQILKYVTNAQGNLRWHNVAPDPAEVSEDTTPQLGGDLDVNGNEIVGAGVSIAGTGEIEIGQSAGNNDIVINPHGTGAIVLKSNDIRMEGAGTVTTPAIKLHEFGVLEGNFISIKPPFSITADTTLTLPDGAGSSGQVLTTNGSGTLSWTTAIGDNSPTIFGVTKLKHVGATDATLAFYDQNASNFVALTVPSDIASNLTFTLPVADGTSGQAMVTDGSGNLSFADAGGSDGWHGSTTRIKLLPRDFVPSDGGRPAMIDDVNIGIDKLFLESHSTLPLYATVAIPTGYKATHVMVHGDNNNTDAVEVWEFQINSATGVSKGTGNVQTEINITDVTSSTTNYLLLSVQNGASKEIHGGYVTIAAV